MRLAAQRGFGGGGVPPFGRIEIQLRRLVISGVKFLERRETGAIVRAHDGRFIQQFQTVEALGGVLVLGQQAAALGGVLGGDDLPGQDVELAPDAAHAGAVVQAGQGIVAHDIAFMLDGGQAVVGDHAHQCHDKENEAETRQDARA
ncbi:hypothetical protein D3C81_1296650 [compost metagenome]